MKFERKITRTRDKGKENERVFIEIPKDYKDEVVNKEIIVSSKIPNPEKTLKDFINKEVEITLVRTLRGELHYPPKEGIIQPVWSVVYIYNEGEENELVDWEEFQPEDVVEIKGLEEQKKSLRHKKCDKCKFDNPSYHEYCWKCGKKLEI